MDGLHAERKILLAVDESENDRRAVEYVGRMLRGSGNSIEVTLLHIIRQPDASSFATEGEKEKYLENRKGKVREFLSRYREQLVEIGLPDQAVNIRCPLRFCPSIAESILSERDICGYSTVVVGRHKVTRAEEFLYGSVSGRLVNHADHCAVWVIA